MLWRSDDIIWSIKECLDSVDRRAPNLAECVIAFKTTWISTPPVEDLPPNAKHSCLPFQVYRLDNLQRQKIISVWLHNQITPASHQWRHQAIDYQIPFRKQALHHFVWDINSHQPRKQQTTTQPLVCAPNLYLSKQLLVSITTSARNASFNLQLILNFKPPLQLGVLFLGISNTRIKRNDLGCNVQTIFQASLSLFDSCFKNYQAQLFRLYLSDIRPALGRAPDHSNGNKLPNRPPE